jgi:hypothetical protein
MCSCKSSRGIPAKEEVERKEEEEEEEDEGEEAIFAVAPARLCIYILISYSPPGC